MRHAITAALLLFAACASTTAPRFLSMRASEVRAMGQHMGAAGTHFIRVRIQNVSAEQVVIHTVRVEASGPDLDSEPGMDVFDQTINPGETVPFDLVLTVTSRNRAVLDQPLESVAVTIGYIAGQQDMVDSGTYSLNHEVN